MVAGAVPFLRVALEASEAVILICGRHTARLLAESYLAAGAGRLRLLGEVDFGPGRRDWAQWASFEAVLNAAMEPYPLWCVCIYAIHAPAASVNRSHPGTGARRGRG